MILTGASLIKTLIVLNVHHHSPNKGVPRWAKTIFLKYLAKMVCMFNEDDTSEDKVVPIDSEEPSEANSTCSLKKEKDLVAVPPEMIQLCQHQLAKEAKMEKTDQYKQQWQRVAAVLDRFFLISASTFTIVTLLTISSVLVSNRSNQN